jgi:multiple sugar transport system ATP-binding protein
MYEGRIFTETRMSQIKVEDLRKKYEVSGRTEVAVEEVNLTIKDGEFLTLVGPSGCGKTTTLRCIAGLETPTSGRILYNGEDITDVPASKRNLAMMFQDIALYPHMDAFKNIAYPLKIDNVPKEEQRKEVEKAAEIMQIPDLLDKYPGELSGGQQQRVALARTIVQSPRAFLMDEPLSDLDAKLQIDVRKEVQRVHKRLQKPTVYVTHNQEEAMTMSDRIAVMNDGHLEQVGNREDLYQYPENVFVANFIGNPSMNFLDATVESLSDETGAVVLDGTRVEFDIDQRLADSDLSDVILGVRPISISLEKATSGDLTGSVVLFEPIDDRAQVTLDTDVGEVIAVVPADNQFEVGNDVALSINPENLYLFDPETEKLVVKSGQTRIRA